MKYSAISIVVLLIMILICPVSASKVIDVPGDSRTIQSAIDAAEAGDIIVVSPGTYKEDIEINKGITLQGAGADETTLFGAVIVKNADGVTIDGFTLDGQRHTDSHRGIWCSSSGLTISSNIVARYHYGITSVSSRTIIEDNIVLENFIAGIEIKTAVEALIRGTSVVNNTNSGITVVQSLDNVLITDSVISGNRIGISCIQCAPEIRRNIIEENEFGLECLGRAEPDLGTDDDPGLNVIKDNKYQIVNPDRQITIQAKGNYWGSPVGPDVSTLDGKVDYAPWLKAEPLMDQPVKSSGKLIKTWGGIKANVNKTAFE